MGKVSIFLRKMSYLLNLVRHFSGNDTFFSPFPFPFPLGCKLVWSRTFSGSSSSPSPSSVFHFFSFFCSSSSLPVCLQCCPYSFLENPPIECSAAQLLHLCEC
ncbi:hypothetical protein ES288_A01G041100v1 [Gossypium darwinii]|uniref:Uncharacterized protein n=1 Tax=Gossypium darwinii TaxID=34276 RepID=A0A5D2HI35_GOSDA|nr:hypothetical protein ES288_A01G041100v1 [Gossypium darwinii]